jgi:hypothetical protein
VPASEASGHVNRIAAASEGAPIVLRRAPPHIEIGLAQGGWPMIYLLAVILPPLGLLLNGQPFAAIFNLILIVPCILLGFIFPGAFLVPSVHAVIAVYMKREDRKHRELVNAIERHGPPPGWRP